MQTELHGRGGNHRPMNIHFVPALSSTFPQSWLRVAFAERASTAGTAS